MQEQETKHIGWIRVLTMIIPYFIIVGLFQLLGYWVSGADMTQNEFPKETLQQVIISFFGMVGTLFLIWIFHKFWDKEKFYLLGFQTSKRLKDFLWGIGLGAVIMGCAYVLFLMLGQISFNTIDFNATEVLLSIVLYTIVAITEEVLVRGYILKNFMISFNKYVALVVSSLIFAIMHGANPNIDMLSLVNLFLAGILLGISYIYTRNLWFPIALHLSWNLFQTLVGFNVSGQDFYSVINFKMLEANALNGGDFGFEGSVFCTIVEILGIVGVGWFYRNSNSSAEASYLIS